MKNINSLEKALHFALESEGGYSDHSADKGGKTNLGITEKTLENYQRLLPKNNRLKFLKIKDIKSHHAKEIYYHLFWLPNKCDEIANVWETASIMYFDAVINSNPYTVRKQFQKAIRKSVDKRNPLVIDGKIGKHTLSELARAKENSGKGYDKNLFFNFEKIRNEYYIRICQRNPSQLVFLTGWYRRARRYLFLA